MVTVCSVSDISIPALFLARPFSQTPFDFYLTLIVFAFHFLTPIVSISPSLRSFDLSLRCVFSAYLGSIMAITAML